MSVGFGKIVTFEARCSKNFSEIKYVAVSVVFGSFD